MLAQLFEANGWPCEFVNDDEICGEIQGSWATYQLRGICTVDLEVQCLERPVHSGMWGGPVPDPVQLACRIIAWWSNRLRRIHRMDPFALQILEDGGAGGIEFGLHFAVRPIEFGIEFFGAFLF